MPMLHFHTKALGPSLQWTEHLHKQQLKLAMGTVMVILPQHLYELLLLLLAKPGRAQQRGAITF